MMHIEHAKEAEKKLYGKLYTLRQMIKTSEKQNLLAEIKKSLSSIQKLNNQIISDFIGVTDRTAQIEKLIEQRESTNENVL